MGDGAKLMVDGVEEVTDGPKKTGRLMCARVRASRT
jgi:hypothetical protein